MRTTFRLFHYLGAMIGYSLAFVMDRLDTAIDFGLSRISLFFDWMLPAPPMLAYSHPMRATRDVSYMTKGVHRMAQPRTRLGDPDDEDGQGDGGDEDDGAQSDIRRC